MNAASVTGAESCRREIYLLGAGVEFPGQVTAQTLEILGKCRKIYTNITEQGLQGLPDDILSKCVSLWPLYQDGRLRRENYADVTAAILAAGERETPIGWLTPGHPTVFDSVTQLLIEAGKERGWAVHVIPAISCIDTILADVGYDPANGLLIHDTTSLVMMEFPLTPGIALLLLQPSTFQTDRAFLKNVQSGPDLAALSAYFLEVYPPDHHYAFVSSSTHTGGRAQVTWGKLSEMASAPFRTVGGASLFVPAAATKAFSSQGKTSALIPGVRAN